MFLFSLYSVLFSVFCLFANLSAPDIIQSYFENFGLLTEAEKWEELMDQGSIALEQAQKIGNLQYEARICAKLTLTAFYLGNYTQALKYANRCHELSENFDDPALFVRALYLESAIHRGLGEKTNPPQAFYGCALQIAQEALQVYKERCANNKKLEGKVYFNLGAAHADNPEGDLAEAKACYFKAIECFKMEKSTEDLIRTLTRMGKIYLIEKKYDVVQKILKEVRPQITTERLSMHADYLEAQLRFALSEMDRAMEVAQMGLTRAKSLRAKRDIARFLSLLQNIENGPPSD